MLKRLLAALLSTLFLLTPALALEGMDVSTFQGRVDFQAASAQVEVVYIRASYGETGVDAYFRQHYQSARAAGLKIGFYHYLEAATPAAARREADHFAALIRGLDYDCRPALDYESFHGLSQAEITAVALAFLTRLESALGQSPMLYTDSYAANHYFTADAARYPLWVAQWQVSRPQLTGPWTDWIGWQYTNEGRVPGVTGRVDRDRFTDAVLLTEDEGPYPTYTVRPGDTLWALSIRYHTTVAELVRLNDIPNPDLIYVGQTLRLPRGSQSTLTYTIRPGDTLWALSIRYHTTVSELARLNQIQNPDLIYAGHTLQIPLPA